MKTTLTLALLFLFPLPSASEQQKSFRDLQWSYPCVRTAAAEKDHLLRQRFQEKGLPHPPHAILLRAFKKEAALELWATATENQPYVLVHNTGSALPQASLAPSADSAMSKSPKASTTSTGSIRKAIFS